MGLRLPYFALAGVLLVTSAARAERIAYRGEGRCPEAYEASFVLAARSPGVALVSSTDDADATMVVTTSPEGYRGVLTMEGGTAREVSAKHCRDVVDALGFVYAVARAERERAAAEAAATAAVEATEPAPVLTLEPPAARDVRAAAPPTRTALETHGALGARGGAASGVGPTLAPRGELFFELALDRASPWLPAMRVGAAYAAADARGRPEGAATFGLWAGTAELHVVRIGGRDGRMRLSPFLRGQVGDLLAESSGLADARREHALWASVGAGASASWSLGTALALEASAGIDVTLARPRFYFEPQTTVHQVAPVGASFAMGVVLPIW